MAKGPLSDPHFHDHTHKDYYPVTNNVYDIIILIINLHHSIFML
jgi:hypothetical protein